MRRLRKVRRRGRLTLREPRQHLGEQAAHLHQRQRIALANAHADFTVVPFVLTANSRVGIGTTAPDQLLSVNGNASKVGGGSWATFSDKRLKNIKAPFTTGLSAVMKLQPVRYEYRSKNALGLPNEGEHVGFGAQEVQKVIPEAVSENSQGYLMINNDPIIWTMLNAIKEQQKEIVELKRRQVARLHFEMGLLATCPKPQRAFFGQAHRFAE